MKNGHKMQKTKGQTITLIVYKTRLIKLKIDKHEQH